MAELFSILRKAVAEASAIRLVMRLKPANADGLVYPPTYDQGQHIFRPAWIEGQRREAVLIDSVQSQANRVELAILDAQRQSRITYPDIQLTVKADTGEESFSVLELSHRIYDAALRMSKVNGIPFAQSPIGRALYSARIENASPLYIHAPITLCLGGWDSHGGGGPLVAKLPRLLTSEIVGLDALPITTGAVKFDPMNIRKEAGPLYKSKDPERGYEIEKEKAIAKSKEYWPSWVGLGSVPSLSARGAVITEAVQTSLISCSAARRLHFKSEKGSSNPDSDLACQTAVVSLALFGLLAQMDAGYCLRSGCDLFPLYNPNLEIIGRTLEEIENYPVDSEEAKKALSGALDEAEEKGFEWRKETIYAEADERLVALVERSRRAKEAE